MRSGEAGMSLDAADREGPQGGTSRPCGATCGLCVNITMTTEGVAHPLAIYLQCWLEVTFIHMYVCTTAVIIHLTPKLTKRRGRNGVWVGAVS